MCVSLDFLSRPGDGDGEERKNRLHEDSGKCVDVIFRLLRDGNAPIKAVLLLFQKLSGLDEYPHQWKSLSQALVVMMHDFQKNSAMSR